MIPLLKSGVDVEGLDLSDYILEVCKSNLKDHNLTAKIYKGNMINFSSAYKYDGIIIPTGSFLLLHHRNDSVKALENFYNNLNDKGILMIDCFIEANISKGNQSLRTFDINDDQSITLESNVFNIDYINQYYESYNRYDLWENTKLIQSELEYFPIRWYGVEEFILLLKSIGFKNIKVHSDYIKNQYPTSEDQIITFEATK